MKRTPLKRKTQMKRGTTQLKRTPMKRGTTTLKRTPMKKVATPDPITKETRAAVELRSGGKCEARLVRRCAGVGHHIHHRKLRRYGDHTLANLLHVCKTDHEWIHANPILAECVGVLIPQWIEVAEVIDECRNLLDSYRSGNPTTPSWRTDPQWQAEAISQFARLYAG